MCGKFAEQQKIGNNILGTQSNCKRRPVPNKTKANVAHTSQDRCNTMQVIYYCMTNPVSIVVQQPYGLRSALIIEIIPERAKTNKIKTIHHLNCHNKVYFLLST